MSSEPTPIAECLPDLLRPEKVREVLDRPFPPEAVRTRPGNFGQTLSYIEAHEYIRRLNEAFGVAWSFQIVQHEILDQEVLVLGRLTTLGHARMAFGGSTITRIKDTGELVSIADDLKAAATDAMKKAASFLGVGLHLYEGGKTAKPANGNGTAPKNGNGNGRLTSRQLDAILAIGKDKGMDRDTIRKMTQEKFGKNVEFVSKSEASSLIQELSAAQ